MNDINWDDLRYILAMHRERTQQAAAKALKVSLTTVNRRIADIESRLGVALFERSGAGHVATAAAQEICEVAQKMEMEVHALERKLAGKDLQLSGPIRITSTDTLMAGLLADCFASFRASYPDISLDILVSNSFFNLARRECDIAIRPSSEPPELLIGRRLGSLATAPYGHRDYLASRPYGRQWSLYDWVAPGAGLEHLHQHAWIGEHVADSQIAARVDSLLAMVQAVDAGMGVAPLLCMLADRHPDLVRLADPIEAMSTDVWMLTHRDLRDTPRIRAFMDHVSAFVAERAPFLKPTRPPSPH
jgi:DNA-binding transcriptional LysR family regulator